MQTSFDTRRYVRHVRLLWVVYIIIFLCVLGFFFPRQKQAMQREPQKRVPAKIETEGHNLRYDVYEEDNGFRLQSAKGAYQSDNHLVFDGGVLLTKQETVFSTQAVHVNPKQKEILGTCPVQGKSDGWRLSAQRFGIRDNGNVIDLKGNVHIEIDSG